MYRAPVRVGFVIINHRRPAQLLRLIGALRLQLPDAPIAVHHDRFRADLDAAALTSIADTYLLTGERPVIWGDFSVVDACWRSICWVVEHVSFDWIVLLSAQDYPIKPLALLADKFQSTDADAIINARPIRDFSAETDLSRRYLFQYSPAGETRTGAVRYQVRRGSGFLVDVINNTQRFIHIYKLPPEMPRRIGVRSRRPPFDEHNPCWYSPVWMALSRRAAEFVADSARKPHEYVKYYRRTIIPSESITATLLCNAPQLNVQLADLHLSRWTAPESGHPDVFGAADLAELLAAPQYFARKFDIDQDAAVLDLLDKHLAASHPAARG